MSGEKSSDIGSGSCNVLPNHANWLERPKLKQATEESIDKINHPKHYTSHPSGIECIQVTEHMSFNLGNVIKYLWRADDKGAPLDDLKKARWYLDREIVKREDK